MEAEVRPVIRQCDRDEKFAANELRQLGELGCTSGMLDPRGVGAARAWTRFDRLRHHARGSGACGRVSGGVPQRHEFRSRVAALSARHALRAAQLSICRDARAAAKCSGGVCLTDSAQAGSDAAAIETRAVRSEDGYLLNGTKSWVTNGGPANVYLVFAKTDPAAGAKGITTFLVEPVFPGFDVSRFEDKMGLRSSRSAEITLTDCPVPLDNRLGEEGQGLKIALAALDGGRVGIAAQAVGIAQGALEAAVRYAKQRRAFGKPISEFQAIEFMLADMQAEIEAARALVWQAAWMRDTGSPRLGAYASRAKLYASEMVNRVVYKAVQIHGSMGYSRESEVERLYRDARVISIYEGTSEIQRMIIARDLLDSGGDGPRQAKEAAESRV